ncbi:lipoyl synthase [Flammeovirga pacifica]|uniref:Lipoyl synthase n=1 Tax=Flammeovirga pacifica TaxID=915059 RepID=A0A1S1Z1N3_FLAPC|nr:lipoyl synthase [Flammeovirga pacifica]OHX67151.1 lipoyl synthase [Flammeovirga pacifica]
MIELPVISSEKKDKPKRRPDWLRVKLPIGKEYANVRKLVDKHNLNTICQSGNCPNMGECWGEGTATFMILGNICTRGCSFCAVATGRPTEYDAEEPKRVADAIHKMEVKHAVITSVNRDELKDRGAEIWYQTVVEIKKLCPETTIETLIPDTRKNWDALYRMIEGGQEVISHNMETVKELYRAVRPQAKYDRSLEHIKRIVDEGRRSKTGIMLGLGETDEQIFRAMDDLAEVGLHVLTLGQYLQPTKMHHEVIEYIHPDKFDFLREEGLKRGITYVESGPLVRSSYHAERHVNVPIK